MMKLKNHIWKITAHWQWKRHWFYWPDSCGPEKIFFLGPLRIQAICLNGWGCQHPVNGWIQLTLGAGTMLFSVLTVASAILRWGWLCWSLETVALLFLGFQWIHVYCKKQESSPPILYYRDDGNEGKVCRLQEGGTGRPLEPNSDEINVEW